MFVTYPIPEQIAGTAKEILELEVAWQKIFNVVDDPDFMNQCYAKGGFCSTKESAAKAMVTRRNNGQDWITPETRQLIREVKQGICTTIHTKETKQKMSNTRRGRKLTPEWRAKISTSNTGKVATEETIAKLRASHLGNKLTPESIAKRLSTIEANGGYSHSDETKRKIGEANRGRKLPPKSAETIAKSKAALTGRKRSLDATQKMHDTLARKRAEREALKKNEEQV